MKHTALVSLALGLLAASCGRDEVPPRPDICFGYQPCIYGAASYCMQIDGSRCSYWFDDGSYAECESCDSCQEGAARREEYCNDPKVPPYLEEMTPL